MSEPAINIIANDIPYFGGQTNPLKALESTVTFSSMDWGEARDTAWIYGIVCGWDEDDPEEESAMPELAAKFGWTDEQVTRLRALHAEFVRMGGQS